MTKVFDGKSGVKVLYKRSKKCQGGTRHLDIIHINQSKNSMGLCEVEKEGCISFRGNEVKIMKLLAKTMKPSTRCLFETIKGFVKMTYVVRMMRVTEAWGL